MSTSCPAEVAVEKFDLELEKRRTDTFQFPIEVQLSLLSGNVFLEPDWVEHLDASGVKITSLDSAHTR